MDYKNAKIYTIRSHQTNAVYVGATCSPLHKRFSEHKKPCNKLTSKQIIDLGDAYIELHEEFPCDNIQQLRKREGEVIRSMDCVNKMIAGRTQKEWVEENKEYVSELNRKNYQKNKTLVLERSQKNYETNKEHLLELRAARYQATKEQQRELTLCVTCNCKVSLYHMTRHKKTKKHLDNLKNDVTDQFK